MGVPAVSSSRTAVTVVLVVPVSPSDVSVIGEVVLSDSGREIVESQIFSLSRKRQALWVERQKDKNTDETGENTSSVQEEDSRNRIRR